MSPLSLLLAPARQQRLKDKRPWFSLPLFTVKPLLLFVVSAYALQGAGQRRLREFRSAPDSLQAQFMGRVREQAEAEREFDRWQREQDGEPIDIRLDAAWTLDQPGLPEVISGPISPPEPVGRRLFRQPIQWTRAWTRRAQRMRDGVDDVSYARLKEIPAPDYVSLLTGEDAERPIPCPFPDHDDRTASFWAYPDQRGWYCFGCHRSGDIFVFAGLLWGLDFKGQQFREIRLRLEQVFA